MKHAHAHTPARTAKPASAKKAVTAAVVPTPNPDPAPETAPETAPAPVAASRDELVRQAAYFYYEQRGHVGGHEVEDWLKAEAEIERLSAVPAANAADSGH